MKASGLLLLMAMPCAAMASAQTAGSPVTISAPITNVKYDVTFDSATAKDQRLSVVMTFDIAGPGPVVLALPAWTPGAYEIDNFARGVLDFRAESGEGKAFRWDKLDYQTWRVFPGPSRSGRIAFDFLADHLDNANAWAQPNFLFFNGTNVFLYPKGRSTQFAATVSIHTEDHWRVVTSMSPVAPRTYRERNYHDLVDMPFFVGEFDLDSLQVAGRWTRLATYPVGAMSGQPREMFWRQIAAVVPPESQVFGETPWPTYSVLAVFDSSYGGGSALEHQSSHLGVYNYAFVGNEIMATFAAHEIFHAWNVKRLRPADLVPYRYETAQPTRWLWVSEGITDYYADLAVVRGEVVDSTGFFELTAGKIRHVAETRPTALGDASLSVWVHPEDGTEDIYYDKGSLAGLLLDILIRDGSDNRRSLDTVMRELYRATYAKGRGFTGAEWWRAVGRASGGRSFEDFISRYVDGRDPYPWDRVLPLAGLRLSLDTLRRPLIGIEGSTDSAGEHVTHVIPGGAAAEAGVRPGDVLLQIGDITTQGDWAPKFRQAYGSKPAGTELPIALVRGSQKLTLTAHLAFQEQQRYNISADPGAKPKAVAIRNGLLRGQTGP